MAMPPVLDKIRFQIITFTEVTISDFAKHVTQLYINIKSVGIAFQRLLIVSIIGPRKEEFDVKLLVI